MRPLWTVAEIVAATAGRPEGLSDGPIGSISIDSREIQPEALFVAIKGDTHDGHDFVTRALEQGAAAALVAETYHARNGGDRLIVVPDPMQALVKLAVAARDRSRAQIIAVTGSAGKTTSKEALRTVLSGAGETHASVKSFNNHWGVPLTLARLPREAQFGVFEIGMNHAGEITPLVKLVRPHIAVITTVAAAHLEFFASVSEIAAAKAEIFLGLEPGGTAVLNGDHAYLHLLFGKAREAGVAHVVTYGFDDSCDWRIASYDERGGHAFARVEHDGESLDLVLTTRGRHMAANAVGALAVAHLSGAAMQPAIQALAGFGAPEGRGETLRLGPTDRPLLLIDESYNANLASMDAALDVFAEVSAPSGKKVLVLGDMLELGAASEALHASLKDAVLRTNSDRIFLVGKPIGGLAVALGSELVAAHAASVDDVAEAIVSSLAHGDAVMIKGSNGVRLHSLVKVIRERFG
jgi:UDP-N-acetylmuramoyl-tripeptide--D-alanyl-D-alanine ligase